MTGQTSLVEDLGVLDALPVGILVSRLSDGSVVFANRRACETFGVDPDAASGLTTTAFYRRREERDAVMHRLGRDGRVDDAEFEMRRADGGNLWVRVSAVLARDAEGDLAIAAFDDITAERNAEQRLRTAYRMEAFRRISGGLAHEVNNALVPILTFGELAMAELEPDSPAHAHLARVMAAADRCSDVVARVMEFSGAAGSERATIDLRATVERSGKLLRAAAPRRIDVDLDLPGSAVEVEAAAELEETILVVALDAADAYAGHAVGHVVLTLGIEDVEPRRASELGVKPGTYARVVVADDGAPVTPDALERAFDPLISDREAKLGRHHGLGLAYRTAVTHCGTVQVDSAAAKGTRVTIWLPLSRGTAEPGAPDAENMP